MVSWDDSYSLGLTYVDNQHRELFSSVKAADSCMRSGADYHEASCNLLYGMLMHFTIEAALLEAYWYGDQEKHRADHQLMLKTLWEMLQEMRDGRRPSSPELLEFLAGWVEAHVAGHNAMFTDYLVVKGCLVS